MNILLQSLYTINNFCFYSATGIIFNEDTISNYSHHSVLTNPINPPIKSYQIVVLSILTISLTYTCLTQLRKYQKLGRLNTIISTAATA